MISHKITRACYFLLFILPAFSGAGIPAVAQSGQGLTPRQVANIKSVGEVVISDDGSYIAYSLLAQADPLEENERASFHLHVYNNETRRSTPYYTGTSVSSINFRPGHNSVTFLTSKGDEDPASLFEIPLDGGEARELYSFETSLSGYDWAPDGNRLAFMAREPVEEKKPVLPYQPDVYEENLVQRRGYITSLPDTGEARRIQVEGTLYQLHWSPDGERLAVAAAPTPLVDDYYMNQQVFIADSEGENIIGKIEHEAKLGQIGWSPDGNRLALIAGSDIHDPIDGRLFMVSADGGTPENLQPNFQGKFEQFEWVDNNTLHYLASKGVWSIYGRIGADGSSMETLVDSTGPLMHQFSRSRNGVTVFEADSPNHPGELFLRTSERNKLQRITFSNPWLKEVNLGRQVLVNWQARDSLNLQGLLIYPVDYQNGEQYPLITVVHGGPEAHYGNGWLTGYSMPGQVGAARGFAVFYPNYRGSTGRGLEFLKSSQGDPAGAEFEDIVDGVDHLIQSGVADSSRVGVTGGSYGGYATGWLSTRFTDRFAAGVMFVGISNNISKWGSSDIPEELYLVHSRKRIWNDYDFFLKRSPIYYAGQAKTPLLIMAGKEDTRVDPSQSYELYRHIKTRTDTPVRLVLYPGEGHGNIHATARLDYNLRMMRWFEEYLKGDEEQPPSEIQPDQVETPY